MVLVDVVLELEQVVVEDNKLGKLIEKFVESSDTSMKSLDVEDMGDLEFTDDEALAAFHKLASVEGIIPALESSHAIAEAIKVAPSMKPDQIIVVNLSGRGDKDVSQVAALEAEAGKAGK